MSIHEAALELRRRTGDQSAQTRSLNAIGLTQWRAGALDQAEESLAACLRLAESIGDESFVTFALMNLGMVANSQAAAGDSDDGRQQHEKALTLLDAALTRLDSENPNFYRVNALYERAAALAGLGRVDEANVCGLEAVWLARELANPLVLAPALQTLAQIKTELGDADSARIALVEALELFRLLGNASGQDQVLRRLQDIDSDPESPSH
jgi:tetratricopeptide (TPR) repeat protein